MWAGRLPLSEAANRDFSCGLLFRQGGIPLDMTGWTFAMQLRVQPGQSGAALVSLVGPAGGIAATPAELAGGRLSIYIAKATLDPLRLTGETRPLHYDLVATLPDGRLFGLLEGPFDLYPGVTR